MSETAARLRGDYADAGPDFVVEQRWQDYRDEQHALWKRLYSRQRSLLPGYACDAFRQSLARLDASEGIPDLEDASRRLKRASGWTLVAVPGLIPDAAFFGHLAERRFPVTRWLREPEEFDYIAEPDIFHDFFGHVPMLFDPSFAEYLQAYGQGGLKAARLDALKMLARLYWYTVEFGLLKTAKGLRIYGAGILSSGGEVVHSIDSPQPRRLRFDLQRVMRTDYRIDRFQDTYFVVENFGRLVAETACDFTPIYEHLRTLPAVAAHASLPGDIPA